MRQFRLVVGLIVVAIVAFPAAGLFADCNESQSGLVYQPESAAFTYNKPAGITMNTFQTALFGVAPGRGDDIEVLVRNTGTGVETMWRDALIEVDGNAVTLAGFPSPAASYRVTFLYDELRPDLAYGAATPFVLWLGLLAFGVVIVGALVVVVVRWVSTR